MTHHNNQYNDASTDDFVDSLHSNDISLIGITNYFFFKDNELEAVRESIRLKNYGITVLGNLEYYTSIIIWYSIRKWGKSKKYYDEFIKKKRNI